MIEFPPVWPPLEAGSAQPDPAVVAVPQVGHPAAEVRVLHLGAVEVGKRNIQGDSGG